MKEKNYKLTKISCFYAYVAMASAFALPPLLFVTFHEMYGISYTLLGTLVLVNFCTQLSIDLIFSFFAKHFNLRITARIMPLITSLGLVVYALAPVLFKGHEFFGLLIGTVIFSVAAGLSEVLISPIVASIPSETPDRDMSLLHSLYAWGVLSVVCLSTLYFSVFGRENWIYLTLFFAVLPITSSVLFCISPMPHVSLGEENEVNGEKSKRRRIGLALCFACIFLGGAAENVMTNWVSGYMEVALNVPKAYGDIFGMALFAILLGLGRTLYAKYGKNISKTLLICMLGASVCYLAAGLSPNAIVAFAACVLTGFATSLLWPGTLILMEEKISNPGVAAYALLAAGGDFGSSVAPQLMGIIVDNFSETGLCFKLSERFSLSAEQVSMKAGMLIMSLFPILGIFVLVTINRFFRENKK